MQAFTGFCHRAIGLISTIESYQWSLDVSLRPNSLPNSICQIVTCTDESSVIFLSLGRRLLKLFQDFFSRNTLPETSSLRITSLPLYPSSQDIMASRRTPHSPTGLTPAHICIGRHLRSRIDFTRCNTSPNSAKDHVQEYSKKENQCLLECMVLPKSGILENNTTSSLLSLRNKI